MEELSIIGTLVSLGGVFASVAGAWWLMRYQINEIRKIDDSQSTEISALWKKLEAEKEKVSLLVQKQGVVSSMLRPDAVAEHTVAMTEMRKDIEYLRRDVDKAEKK